MLTTPTLKGGIALYSEAIWLYFGLAIYAKIEWDILELPLPQLWLLACLLGYLSQRVMIRRLATLKTRYVITTGFLVILIGLNLNYFSGDNSSYNLALLLCMGYLFFRSCFYAHKEPTRAQMLLRFEGNVLWYILFILILGVHPTLQSLIHFPFMVGIVISLAAMVLTLQQEEGKEAGVEVKLVGQPHRLVGIISTTIVLGPLVSILFLIPQVRVGLISTFNMLKGVSLEAGNLLLQFLTWLLSLSSPEEKGAILTKQAPIAPVEIKEADVVAYAQLPMFWIILILAILAVFALLWFLPRLLPKNNSTVSIKEKAFVYQKGENYFLWLWRKIQRGLKRYIKLWRMSFPGFYKFEIYWYFHLIQKWGKKVGIVRFPHETPSEYGERLISCPHVPEQYVYKGQTFYLKESISDVISEFNSLYYGGKTVREDKAFDFLLHYLRNKTKA